LWLELFVNEHSALPGDRAGGDAAIPGARVLHPRQAEEEEAVERARGTGAQGAARQAAHRTDQLGHRPAVQPRATRHQPHVTGRRRARLRHRQLVVIVAIVTGWVVLHDQWGVNRILITHYENATKIISRAKKMMCQYFVYVDNYILT